MTLIMKKFDRGRSEGDARRCVRAQDGKANNSKIRFIRRRFCRYFVQAFRQMPRQGLAINNVTRFD